jgi:hypothetical protein
MRQMSHLSVTNAHADGTPGFWSIARHDGHLYVISVIEGSQVLDPSEMAVYRLEALIGQDWVTLRRDSRLVGGGPAGVTTVMTFESPQDTASEYRLVP